MNARKIDGEYTIMATPKELAIVAAIVAGVFGAPGAAALYKTPSADDVRTLAVKLENVSIRTDKIDEYHKTMDERLQKIAHNFGAICQAVDAECTP